MSAAIALIVSLALMPLAVRLGRGTGLVDRPAPGGLKIHASPVSVVGGPAAIVATLVALGVRDAITVGLLAGVCLAVATGLIDDVKMLPPWPRVALTGISGAIAASGVMGDDVVFSIVIGAILGIACTNAVNIVDGQDGLAGGLSCIAALSMGFAAHALDLPSVLTLGLATSAALIGFLWWNRPPARVFLGDGGAYGVGILLATEAIVLVASGPRGFIAAALCLGPFAFELMLTALRRALVRTPVAVGDRLHSYDLLAERIGSRPRATLGLWLIGGACGGAGFAAAALPLAVSVIIAGAVVVVAIITGFILLRGTILSPRRLPS